MTLTITTKTIDTNLEVIEKYNLLTKESLGVDSVYIRTKETLEDLFKQSNMTSTDKASVLANVLGSLTNSLTSAAMQTALDWAYREKELQLRKTAQLMDEEIKEQELALAKEKLKQSKYELIAIQANTWRTYGKPTVNAENELISLTDSGKMYLEERNINLTGDNLEKQKEVYDTEIDKSHATIHQIIADTVSNYGAWGYSITEDGFNVTPSRRDTDTIRLADLQAVIAKEQAKGYGYNAKANALTASASMIGTAMAADVTEVGSYLNVFEQLLVSFQNVEIAPGLNP